MIKYFSRNNNLKNEVYMERIKIHFNNQFLFMNQLKQRLITYHYFKYDEKHKNYRFHNKYEKIKLGVQLCNF